MLEDLNILPEVHIREKFITLLTSCGEASLGYAVVFNSNNPIEGGVNSGHSQADTGLNLWQKVRNTKLVAEIRRTCELLIFETVPAVPMGRS